MKVRLICLGQLIVMPIPPILNEAPLKHGMEEMVTTPWRNRVIMKEYDGLYDVNNNEDINIQGLSYIWNNRT